MRASTIGIAAIIAVMALVSIPARAQRKDARTGKRTMLLIALNEVVWVATNDATESQRNLNDRLASLTRQYPDIGLSQYKVYPGERTYCYAVSDALRELIVIWKGTEPGNADDLFNDGQIAIGFEPARVNFAVQRTKALMARYSGYRTTITGYSLGGTVAEETAAKIGSSVTGVGFNTGSSPLRPSRPAANVKSYHISGDLISSFTGFGNTRRVRLEKTHSDAHSLYNFHLHFVRGTLPDRRRRLL
jgi:pimeloyl-ACP methyl ester carboxylesterase